MFKKILQFFREVKVEFTKVSWPSSRELWQSTLIVFVVSAIVAAFIGLVDISLSKLVTLVLG
ncbi:MAG: preprotein translocase subunit SecE [Candidatus Edwardsbacteria bacterium]|nr:preprotein translocase subunit SecE [Candidatus Edwardsbacteria bacterium]